MKIAVLTSGGDAPGMNAVLRAVIRTASYKGIETCAVRDGYKGLVAGDISSISKFDVSNIIFKGGTILGSSRFPEFENIEIQNKAVKVLKNNEIDALIVIGGDGSFLGAKELTKLGVVCICIPATIDNDIETSDYTIGFDTACNTIVQAIDRVRDTASSHNRCTIVEIMGRDCGDLSIHSATAAGCDYVITKEDGFDEKHILEELTKNRNKGKQHAIIALAENIIDPYILKDIVEKNVGYETRVVILGHTQRGGAPSAFDRILACKFGSYAIDLISTKLESKIVGFVDGNITGMPINFNKTSNNKCDYLYKIFDSLK